MAGALANPQVQINNQTWYIVPNSFRVVAGFGETNVRAASTGNGGVETIHTVNAESQIGKIMITVYPVPDQIRRLAEIKEQPGQNVVSFSEEVDGAAFSGALNNASMTNDPEIAFAAEGEYELEFSGTPITF